MYTLLECLAIAGLVLGLGAGLFIAASLIVLVEAGVRTVATRTQRSAPRETTGLDEKLDTSPPSPGGQPWRLNVDLTATGSQVSKIFLKSRIHGGHHADPDC